MNRDIILLGGMTGWGKSLWAKIFSYNAKRLLVFDPTLQWPNTKFDDADGGLDDFLDSIDSFRFLENKERREFRVGTSDPERAGQLGAAAFLEGRNLLILEESSMLFEKGQRRLDQWLSRLVFLGRHQSCSIIVIAQRFMSVPIDIRSQANRVITFNQHEEDDVGYLQSVFGKEEVKKIPNLPKLRCLDRCNNELYEYSIHEQAERTLGIKLDMDTSVGYTRFYKEHSAKR